ncbi:Dipeptidyl-peptidase IV [Allomuricauda ruestringensis DSM 13258]|uniref:Dipeptidyl-peptidase IV n=1 Tax=Allomuricauda ruestringensis (strain DSM 13258 / CIP 107369 / LMG 19739 / B1) TaxID=886377 RepID=G2PKU8_ALLRU|nr:S9 family peptidase [Allomuricauda ruestringensis]AEM69927.1 Dipeptidyl-peptidase IV [Allomuricauda ruestringensis DSM 13258]
MNKQSFLFLFLLGVLTFTTAQKKKITLEEIWGGEFRTEHMDVLRSMDNGTQYTILNTARSPRSSSLDKYDYETLEKVETIVASSDAIPYFSSYTFSDDESKVLLATEVEPIFRHSRLGIYYVYDIASKELAKISETKIQEPILSPDGSKVAYVLDNNLYILDLTANTTKQVTTDGSKGTIINGVTDWVYEEEFAFVRAFEWNSDGTKIAFLRFDETEVPHFSMDVYGKDLYPYQHEFKYPKAGEKNSIVTLHMYDVASGNIADVDLNDPYYIPRIKWMHNPNDLSVQTLNRHQNDLKLYVVNAKDNSVSILLEETDEAYVDIDDDLTFLDDDSFIWTSETDGFNHLYLYGRDGKLKNQITEGPWEVTRYYGYDEKHDRIFYQSVENGSINRGVYSISTKGKRKKALSTEEGTNSAAFSSDFTYYINTFSSASTPYKFTLHKASDGKLLKEIKDNSALLNKLEGYEIAPKAFSTININGYDLNMYMIKPADFDPNKKYPLFMFQYSGPGSQQVANRWMGSNDYWHQLLASQGYIVACVDGRGTGLKGRDFKKLTQKELGKYEVEDQIAAAQKLSDRSYIDKSRTGIWGWSYGGFMSTNCLLKGNDTFEMAIAVAPVTSWRFYDTIYTERYMQTPQENPTGYDDNSPFNYPELLKGNYLLVHGSGDDNVHVQNTMRMIEALVQANKQFDWAIYPDKNHGIYGGNTRLHLYTKMTNFIKENL